jgi:hypothetical protein
MKKLIYVTLLVLSAGLPGCLNTTATSGTVGVTPDSVTVAAGTTQSFSAILTGSVAGSTVKWSISGQGCSAGACGTIDQNGMYKAPSQVPAHPLIQVVATPISNPSKSGFANVTIAQAASIAFSSQPPTLTVAAGQNLSPFEATVTNTSNTTVNWTVTGTGCTGAACGTITPSTPNGTSPASYTAPPNLPNPPSVTITAASAADPTKTVSLNVSLVLEVVLTPKTPNPGLLNLDPVAIAVSGQGGNAIAVTWSLNQSGNACSPACGTIDQSGNYTAPAAVPAPPTVTVVASVLSGPANVFTGTGQTTLTVAGGSTTQLFGSYAFFYRGYPTGSSSPVVEAGSLVFGANGQLHGLEDDNDGTTPHVQQAVTGTFSLDANNTTGSITLSGGIVAALRFSVVPHSTTPTGPALTVYISGLNGTTPGSGEMDLQDPTALTSGAVPTGGFAISMRGGTNGALTKTFASAVGRFDLSAGSISAGELGRAFLDSTFGPDSCLLSANQVINASLTPAYPVFSGSYGAANATTGHATLTLQNVQLDFPPANATDATLNSVTIPQMALSSYTVSATKLFLMETDTSGFAFVGSAERQQPSHTFVNGDFNGNYGFLLQSNHGQGAGNAALSPIFTPTTIPATGTVTGLNSGEYIGNLDGALQFGLNTDIGFYSMVQTNGLALTTLCLPGFSSPHFVMYFTSASKAFVWNQDSNINAIASPPTAAVPNVADMIGEIDQRNGGPFGGNGQAGFPDSTPYSFVFEGVDGSFAGTHNPTGGIVETGSVVFLNQGTACVFFTAGTAPPCVASGVGQNGSLQQTGTATFTLDEATSTGSTTANTLTATFLFNDDEDGNDDSDSFDQEGYGTLAFSPLPAFRVPDHFVLVSPNKILFLFCGLQGGPGTGCKVGDTTSTTSNIVGSAVQQ